MSAHKILSLSMSMKIGQCIYLHRDTVIEAAKANMSGLDAFMGVRQDDIDRAISKMEKNWDFSITQYDADPSMYIFKKVR